MATDIGEMDCESDDVMRSGRIFSWIFVCCVELKLRCLCLHGGWLFVVAASGLGVFFCWYGEEVADLIGDLEVGIQRAVVREFE